MKILLYVLTPIVAYIVDLLAAILSPIINIPITWILIKLQRNPVMYGFRPDMIANGIVRGYLTVYFTSYLLSLFETEISFWWIVVTMALLSYLSISAWDRTKPHNYEMCLCVSPILGYIIGLLAV